MLGTVTSCSHPLVPAPRHGYRARARAGLLANSGCFVIKCVLWCVCGVLRVFCDVLRVFLRCFASVLRYFHKTHKIPENHRKSLENTKNSQYARVLREFSKSKTFRLYCTEHLLQNICKTPQNSHKTRFVKLRRKTLRNTRKTLENVTTKRSQYSRNTYCAHSVFSPKIR